MYTLDLLGYNNNISKIMFELFISFLTITALFDLVCMNSLISFGK